MAYEDRPLSHIEDLPYEIIPGEIGKNYDNIFLERAVIGERLRATIGLPIRNMSEHAPLSEGIDASAIDEKYYDPPLINIIKFACHSCPEKRVLITNGCQGCCLLYTSTFGAVFTRVYGAYGHSPDGMLVESCPTNTIFHTPFSQNFH